MHTRAWLVISCGIALLGCVGSKIPSNSPGGTTASAAAEALTKAVSFTGGTLLNGGLPAETASDVSLVPAVGDAVQPGDSALMSFDVDDPSGQPVIASLIQFEDSTQHFEVPTSNNVATDAGAPIVHDGGQGADDGGSLPADAGAKPDAGKSAKLHFKLSYDIDANVCKQLCDIKYKLKLQQAVKLKNGKISKHATGSLELDCTSKGDHALCSDKEKTMSAGGNGGSGGSADAGKNPMPGAKVINAYVSLNASVCACATGTAKTGCGVSSSEAMCSRDAFDNNGAAVSKQLSCIEQYLASQTTCVTAAKCDPVKLAKCDYVINGNRNNNDKSGVDGGRPDPIEVQCGAFPAALKSDLDMCGSNTTVMKTFTCQSGETLTIDKLCNGVKDCKDNGDESNICVTCTGSSTMYPMYKQCDGIKDCADNSDEMSCTFMCSNGKQSVPKSVVCDGLPNCSDASDEAKCPMASP